MLSRFNRFWFKDIDASALAVFRIMFGAILLFESVNYGVFLCLDCIYREPELLFKYAYFEWVRLLPGYGLELVFFLMGICAFAIMLGWHYRVAMFIYTVCFAYIFLLDQSLYLNHYYLALLFCAIMIFVPANALWSVDAKRSSRIASATVPNWSRIWLVAQLEIVLLYAGLVKLNSDWLNLEPMRLWMVAESQGHHPIFQWLTQDPGIALASYGVIILHLVGAPLLFWKRTRLPVFFLYCVFHTINALVFNIGIFPFMTVAATLLFFSPDWPKRFKQWWLNRKTAVGEVKTNDERLNASLLSSNGGRGDEASSSYSYSNSSRVLIVGLITIWLIAQVVIPVRHFWYPGSVAWNEAGHRFSWRMKLRDKRGQAKFYVMVNGNKPVIEDGTRHLRFKQRYVMNCIPDLIWQYAQFLEETYSTQADDEVKVFVDARCSLNTREPAPFINRLVDLTEIDRNEPVQNWVLPLDKPLPRKILPI